MGLFNFAFYRCWLVLGLLCGCCFQLLASCILSGTYRLKGIAFGDWVTALHPKMGNLLPGTSCYDVRVRAKNACSDTDQDFTLYQLANGILHGAVG